MSAKIVDIQRRKTISEEELLQAVIRLAHLCRWRVAHFRPARTAAGSWRTAVQGDGKGFPDLVLARRGEVIFAELKSKRGVLSDEQGAWFEALMGGHTETPVGTHRVVLWRPEHWSDGTIEAVLR